MKKARILALILAALSLLIMLAACADVADDPSDTTTTAAPIDPSVDPVTDDTSEEVSPLGVPDDLTFPGKTFTIFTWSNQTQWEWDATDFTGDKIKDAIYQRTINVEERFDISLNIIKQTGDWDNRNSFIQAVAASVLTGAQAYDLVGQYTPAAAIGAMQELYVDINDVDYVNLNSSWWPGDIAESCAINGKLYFLTGDITPTLIRNMGTIMVNLDKAESFGLENMYELVDSGDWTMEAFKRLALGRVSLDGSGDIQEYGITLPNNVIFDNLFYGGGFKYVTPEADGTLSMSADLSSEKLVNWFKECQSLLNDNGDVAIVAVNKAFTSGNALFHLGQVSDVQNYLKDVEFNYGILPFPKYDSEQANYATIVGYWVTMYSVPVDAPDQTMSGAVLETLGYEGAMTLTPVVYEQSFQYRYLNTPENARMFDLLHDTLVYDTGRFFADQISCFAAFRQAATPAMDWTSYVTAQKKLWDKKIVTVYEQLG